MRFKIAYIIPEFPTLTEHFIINEIIDLRRKIDIEVYAIRKGDAINNPSTGVDVCYCPGIFSTQILGVHIAAIANSPRRYIQKLITCIKFNKSPLAILKNIRNFLLGVYLSSEFKRKGVKHIHSHFALLPTDLAIQASIISCIPFSFSAHAHDIYVTPHKIIKKIHAALFIIVCTKSNQIFLDRILQETGYTAEKKIYHIYHGIDPSRWISQRTTKPFCNKSKLNILCVGRLVEKKGITYLIDAVKLLNTGGIVTACTIIGDGPLSGSLKEKVSDSKLQATVTFTGMLSHEEIKSYYDASDVFVLPCITCDDGDRDGLPNVLLEAAVMGLPIISTAISAIPELIEDHETGLLVPEKDASAIAKAIRILATDAHLQSQLIIAARNKIQQAFSIQQSTLMLEELFFDYTSSSKR